MLWALDFVMAIFGAVRGLMVMEVVIFMTVGLLDKLLTVRGLMVNLIVMLKAPSLFVPTKSASLGMEVEMQLAKWRRKLFITFFLDMFQVVLTSMSIFLEFPLVMFGPAMSLIKAVDFASMMSGRFVLQVPWASKTRRPR